MNTQDFYRMEFEVLKEYARIPITCLENQASVFARMALDMAEVIEKHNRTGSVTVLIIPFGPTGQYPIFTDYINRKGISLKQVWMITMDDWLDSDWKLVGEETIHSLRRKMKEALYSKILPELRMPKEQMVFPDPENLEYIPELIQRLGGVDICFAGFGINGHLGFNEPEEADLEDFMNYSTRIVKISETTRTIKASSALRGDLEDIPEYGVTVGMREMMGARAVRVYCFRDWHSGAIRRAACGEIETTFPASLLQKHADVQIICSPNAIAPCY